MRKILGILVFVFATTALSAQLAAQWQQIYGGPGVETSYGVRSCLSPGYISVGVSSSAGPSDGYIFKTDTLGVALWSKFYGGTNIDVFRSIELLPDSGFIVAGFTNSFGNGGYDGWLLRMDKNGDTLWSRTCGTTNWDFFYDVEVTRDSGFLCAGGTYGLGSGDEDMYLVKFDKNGDSLWARTYGGVKQDEARGVVETEDSLIAMCGFTYSLTDTLGESWLLRMDTIGNVLWTRTLGDSTAEDRAYGLHYDPIGDIIIFCGYSKRTGNGDAYWDGVFYNNTHWLRTEHTGALFEEYTAIRIKPGLASITTTGTTFTYGGGDGDMLFFGSPDWLFSSRGTIKEDHGYDVDFAYDGGYILAGSTLGYNSIVENAFLIKLDTAYQTSATVDVIDHVTGASSSVYPVPASNEVFVQISGDDIAGQEFDICVTDITGRVITNTSQIVSQGPESQALRISTEDFTNGLYFLSVIQNGEIISSAKFVIAK